MANGLMEMLGGQENMAAAVPNRRLGQPEDIAGTIVYLCSRAAGHLNGTTIAIDGGSMWARSSL
jgi:NAD(P)-dependent dehydrogenase (short-subunit alcohol dehydrogenase family)